MFLSSPFTWLSPALSRLTHTTRSWKLLLRRPLTLYWRLRELGEQTAVTDTSSAATHGVLGHLDT